MRNRKWLVLSILAASVFALLSFNNEGSASKADEQHGTYSEFTPEQFQAALSKVSEFNTKHGTFVRVDEQLAVDKSETVYDMHDINAKTKQMILDYGIFVKQ